MPDTPQQRSLPGHGGAVAIPGFSHLEQVGRGGFSIVYRAFQSRLDRWVALKILLVDQLDTKTEQRFLRECAAAGRLSSHPNIVTVFDSGITDQHVPFIAMEYLSDGSLGDRVQREGPLPLVDVLDVGVKIGDALESAHREGIIHRDVKPQNILLSSYDEPLLTDFGIASIVEISSVSQTSSSFTPSHAPPEVLQGQRPGPPSDVYSLASTLYHLLVGHPAFVREEDESFIPVLYRVVNEPVPPIDRDNVPPSLANAITEAMAKDPARRPPTAGAFADTLRQIQAAEGLDRPRARRPRPTPVPPRPTPAEADPDATVLSDRRRAEAALAHPPQEGPDAQPTPAPSSPSADTTRARAPRSEPSAVTDDAVPTESGPGGSRVTAIVIGVVAGLALMGVALFMVVSAVGPTSTTTTLTTDSTAVIANARAGTDLEVESAGPGAVRARWKPGSEPRAELVVSWYRKDSPDRVPTVGFFFPNEPTPTPGSYVVSDLDPGTGYCFAVAVSGTKPLETSEPKCLTVEGATATTRS